MTLLHFCERCAERKPSYVPLNREEVRRGPNGRLLCGGCHRRAWDEHDEPGSEGNRSGGNS